MTEHRFANALIVGAGAGLSASLARTLANLSLAAIMIDGLVCGEHTVLVALGIDDNGMKHVLGLWEGATENSTACKELLSNLIERGLDSTRAMLFVIDGSKALAKAVRDTFGKRSFIQRCQVHKRRNVLEHLPEKRRTSIGAMITEEMLRFISSGETTTQGRVCLASPEESGSRFNK